MAMDQAAANPVADPEEAVRSTDSSAVVVEIPIECAGSCPAGFLQGAGVDKEVGGGTVVRGHGTIAHCLPVAGIVNYSSAGIGGVISRAINGSCPNHGAVIGQRRRVGVAD